MLSVLRAVLCKCLKSFGNWCGKRGGILLTLLQIQIYLIFLLEGRTQGSFQYRFTLVKAFYHKQGNKGLTFNKSSVVLRSACLYLIDGLEAQVLHLYA